MKALSNNLLTTSSGLYNYSEFIVVENNDEKNFKVSQDLLCRYSPGFARIFNLTGTNQVKDVSITTFEYFATWLQQQPYWDKTWMDHESSLQEQRDRLTEQDKQRGILYLEPTPVDIPDNGEDVWYMALPIIKLYLFATAYNIPLLQRDAIDRLVWCCATTRFDFEAAEEIHFVYRNTVHGSPLRKVLVDAFCCTSWMRCSGMQGYSTKLLVGMWRICVIRASIMDMAGRCGWEGVSRGSAGTRAALEMLRLCGETRKANGAIVEEFAGSTRWKMRR
jgi:hypothetical protein